jgi:hypothetical protein
MYQLLHGDYPLKGISGLCIKPHDTFLFDNRRPTMIRYHVSNIRELFGHRAIIGMA